LHIQKDVLPYELCPVTVALASIFLNPEGATLEQGNIILINNFLFITLTCNVNLGWCDKIKLSNLLLPGE